MNTMQQPMARQVKQITFSQHLQVVATTGQNPAIPAYSGTFPSGNRLR